MISIRCEGSHYSMGFSQGKRLPELVPSVKKFLHLPIISYSKPKFIPFWIILLLGKFFAWHSFRRKIQENHARRIDGIADGSGMDRKLLYTFNMGELFFGLRKYECTSFCILPEKSESGETILAKNYDLVDDFRNLQIVRFSRPEDGYATLDLTEIFLAGNHNGINEKGLAITYTMVNARSVKIGITPTLAVQEVLEKCGNVDEGVELLKKMKIGRGANFILADPSSAALVEAYPEKIHVRYSGSYLVSTNHFVEMKEYDFPENARYPRNYHPALRGKLFHQSSRKRNQRASELLEKGIISIEKVKAILGDHQGKPSDTTICRHSEVFQTLASVILFPKRKSILVAPGNPCREDYMEFRHA